jgi:hypothetical protein
MQNYVGHFKYPNTTVLNSIWKTLREAFGFVRCFQDEISSESTFGNVVFFASDRDIKFYLPEYLMQMETRILEYNWVKQNFQNYEIAMEDVDGMGFIIDDNSMWKIDELQKDNSRILHENIRDILPDHVWDSISMLDYANNGS